MQNIGAVLNVNKILELFYESKKTAYIRCSHLIKNDPTYRDLTKRDGDGGTRRRVGVQVLGRQSSTGPSSSSSSSFTRSSLQPIGEKKATVSFASVAAGLWSIACLSIYQQNGRFNHFVLSFYRPFNLLYAFSFFFCLCIYLLFVYLLFLFIVNDSAPYMSDSMPGDGTVFPLCSGNLFMNYL